MDKFRVWNMSETWKDDNSPSMYLVDTIEADNLIEACILAPALFPEVQFFRVDGPVRGEIHSIEFPATERGNFDELRDLLQI